MCGAPDRRSPLAALAQPTSDTTHVSVTKPPTPPPLPPPPPPPTSGTNPVPLPPTTLCPRLPPPPSPLHPGPGLQDPSSVTPCQQHLPFRFPVHRLHWSCHSLSPIVPLPVDKCARCSWSQVSACSYYLRPAPDIIPMSEVKLNRPYPIFWY